MIDLDPSQRPTLSVDEFAEVAGISRSSAFLAVHDKTVPSIRFGKRIRIPTSAVRKLLGLDGGAVSPLVSVGGDDAPAA